METRTIPQADGWIRHLWKNSIGQTLGCEIAPDGSAARDIAGLHHFAAHIISAMMRRQYANARQTTPHTQGAPHHDTDTDPGPGP